MSLKTFKFYFF